MVAAYLVTLSRMAVLFNIAPWGALFVVASAITRRFVDWHCDRLRCVAAIFVLGNATHALRRVFLATHARLGVVGRRSDLSVKRSRSCHRASQARHGDSRFELDRCLFGRVQRINALAGNSGSAACGRHLIGLVGYPRDTRMGDARQYALAGSNLILAVFVALAGFCGAGLYRMATKRSGGGRWHRCFLPARCSFLLLCRAETPIFAGRVGAVKGDNSTVDGIGRHHHPGGFHLCE